MQKIKSCAKLMGKHLTKRAEDYSKWYNELVVKADLAERSEPVRDIGPGGLNPCPPGHTKTISDAAQRPDQGTHGARNGSTHFALIEAKKMSRQGDN